MLTSRPEKRWTKAGVTIRMNPAIATSFGAKASISAASAASNASRVACLRCGTTRAGTPRCSAKRRPPAPASLLITAATGTPAFSTASRLLPRPEMRTTTDIAPRMVTAGSENAGDAIAVLLEQGENALGAVEMERADGDERAPLAQLPLHPKSHHDAAVENDPLGEARVMIRELRVAHRKPRVDLPDRRQVPGKIGSQHLLGARLQVSPTCERVLEQRHLRRHRELVEDEHLLLDAFHLEERHASLARARI